MFFIQHGLGSLVANRRIVMARYLKRHRELAFLHKYTATPWKNSFWGASSLILFSNLGLRSKDFINTRLTLKRYLQHARFPSMCCCECVLSAWVAFASQIVCFPNTSDSQFRSTIQTVQFVRLLCSKRTFERKMESTSVLPLWWIYIRFYWSVDFICTTALHPGMHVFCIHMCMLMQNLIRIQSAQKAYFDDKYRPKCGIKLDPCYMCDKQGSIKYYIFYEIWSIFRDFHVNLARINKK